MLEPVTRSSASTRASATRRRRPSRSGGRRRAPAGADLRRPAPRRAAAPLRLPARARRRAGELGGPEGRARSSPARSTSPCTSRTTRSSTRPSRARSRRASTGPARSRSGTTARTSSSRRSRTAASRSGSTARGWTGLWSLVPARPRGDPKNWLILRKRETVRAARGPERLPADAGDAGGGAPARRRLAVRAEVGRLSRARVRARRARRGSLAAAATS